MKNVNNDIQQLFDDVESLSNLVSNNPNLAEAYNSWLVTNAKFGKELDEAIASIRERHNEALIEHYNDIKTIMLLLGELDNDDWANKINTVHARTD